MRHGRGSLHVAPAPGAHLVARVAVRLALQSCGPWSIYVAPHISYIYIYAYRSIMYMYVLIYTYTVIYVVYICIYIDIHTYIKYIYFL